MMALIMIMLTLMSTMMFIQVNHPLAMGLNLLIQTALICLMTGMISKTFWFSYILFMIFLGGMLVLFIYVAALASNEMFSLSTKTMTTHLIIALVMILLIMSDMYTTSPMTYNNEIISISEFKSLQMENTINLIKLYNKPTNYTTIMLMSYLLITLIAVVKVTNVFEGPLRKIN